MRYEPLTRYLEGRRDATVTLSFHDIEAILDRALPSSARRHQAWWANTETHSHADSWLRIGWRTRNLNLADQMIAFERADRMPTRGLSDGAVAFEHEAPRVAKADLVTVDRGKLGVTARRILDDYTTEFGGDVQAALDKALHEARIAFRRRLIGSIVRSGAPSSVSSVDLIREDRDAR